MHICSCTACSTVLCSSFPLSFVLVFHRPLFQFSTVLCSSFPPSFVLVFHRPLFQFSTVLCSSFPLSFVPVFHRPLFQFSTVLCSSFPPSFYTPTLCACVLHVSAIMDISSWFEDVRRMNKRQVVHRFKYDFSIRLL